MKFKFLFSGAFLILKLSNISAQQLDKQSAVNVKELHFQSSNLINPLLDCTTLNHSKVRTMINLENCLRNEVNKAKEQMQVKKMSIYYRELNSGGWIGVNENEQYFPASLLKIPFMMAALKQAEMNPEFLNRMIFIDSPSIENLQNIGNNGFQLKIGSQQSIRTLIENMIIYSDNHSKDILVRHIEPQILESLFYDFGFDIYKDNHIGKLVSVREYSIFLRVLYNSTYLNKNLSNFALETLSKTKYRNGIPAGVPKDVVVAHKFGEATFHNSNIKLLHDCGIIYHKDKNYILAIMAEGTDFEKVQNLIKSISKIVYTQICKK